MTKGLLTPPRTARSTRRSFPTRTKRKRKNIRNRATTTTTTTTKTREFHFKEKFQNVQIQIQLRATLTSTKTIGVDFIWRRFLRKRRLTVTRVGERRKLMKRRKLTKRRRRVTVDIRTVDERAKFEVTNLTNDPSQDCRMSKSKTRTFDD